MIAWLEAPYPLTRNSWQEWLFFLGTGVFVAFFLIVFQPFGTDSFESATKYLFLAGYGAVITVTMAMTSWIIPRVLPTFFEEESWTVGKQILFLTVLVTTAFATCYFYKNWYLGLTFSLRGFLYFLPLALSVAIFPIAGLVVGNYIYLLKHYEHGAAAMAGRDPSSRKAMTEAASLVLPDEQGKPCLTLSPDQLLAIKSADNYVEVYYWEENQLQRLLIRNTLSALETLLENTSIVRCHRSYLVNLNQVTQVTGNAQGYRLLLGDHSLSIPVARSRSEAILGQLG